MSYHIPIVIRRWRPNVLALVKRLYKLILIVIYSNCTSDWKYKLYWIARKWELFTYSKMKTRLWTETNLQTNSKFVKCKTVIVTRLYLHLRHPKRRAVMILQFFSLKCLNSNHIRETSAIVLESTMCFVVDWVEIGLLFNIFRLVSLSTLLKRTV